MATPYTTRPLSDRTWFRPPAKRERTRFQAKWTQTLELLGSEVAAIKGRNLVIEVDIPAEQFRLDGTPRANAKATSPAVIVSFESKHGPLMYRCDRFVAGYYSQPDDWQQNVRAIALTLQALRAVDRYGAAESGEQYRGYASIGSEPFAPHKAAITADEAWARLADLIGVPVANARVDVDRTLRRAQRAAHPDTGGSVALWASYEAAAAVVSS